MFKTKLLKIQQKDFERTCEFDGINHGCSRNPEYGFNKVDLNTGDVVTLVTHCKEHKKGGNVRIRT